MTHDILVWLLDLIRRAPEPVRTAAADTSAEAIEITFAGRRFRILVEAVAS